KPDERGPLLESLRKSGAARSNRCSAGSSSTSGAEMTRRGFLTGTVAVLASYQAHAQLAVVCPTCSSLVDQITSIAKQAQSYLTQLTQLQTELSMYASMIRNSVAIPFQAFATVQADINQVRGLANAASLLTGNAGPVAVAQNLAPAPRQHLAPRW